MEKRRLRDINRWVLCSYLVICLGVIMVTAFLLYVYTTRGLKGLVRFEVGPVMFHFNSMPVILISSIVGFAPAMVSFLFLFIGSIIVDISRAYTVFVYLIAAIVSFFAVRKRWFSEEMHNLLPLSCLLAFILGDVQMILASLSNGRGLEVVTIKNIFFFFLGEMPECSIAVIISYLFLIKAPDRVRFLTGPGRLYMQDAKHVDAFSQIRTSKLSRLVVGLIVVEGVVLGVAASAFANALLPTIGEDAFSTSEGSIFKDIQTWYNDDEDESYEELLDDLDTYFGEPDSESSPAIDKAPDASDSGSTTNQEADSNEAIHQHHRRFVLNRSGVAFDIKLIMLLMNTTIPFIALSSLFAQRFIVSPIVMMSSSIREFCDVPQQEKESKLKEIQRMPIHSNDEIGELYVALNQMATNIVLFVDEEREKEKLAADLLVAQRTSENKSNFLSNVSHELRTPINAVLGLDEMILRESNDDAITAYATDIQNAGKSLLGLVNDILDSSKLEEGKMELIPTEYELSSMINDLINMIMVKAQDKGLALEVNVNEETPHILYGDEIRIKQVILNILTNAVKYTEEGTVTMDIDYEKLDDDYISLKVRVVDTGIGIKEEDLEKLFSRFERIEEERNKTIEGTGLGMNIVRQLLALMDSELQVQSVYGEGSDFYFEISQRVVKWQPIGNFNEAYKNFVAGIAEYEAAFVAPDARILVVDDTPMNLTVVKGLLKETLVDVSTASSGMEALELVRKNKYDLIFMDQRMPEMDGVETYHTMQAMTEAGRNASADAPVIMLTANAVSGSREEFLKEGFADYLSKPVDSKKLEYMVREYLPQEKLLDPAAYAADQALNADGTVAEAEQSPTADGAAIVVSANGTVAEDGASAPDESSVNGGTTTESGLTAALKGLASIDYDKALKNCGSEELLIQVLKDYLEAIPSKSTDIRDYQEREDYHNYTILVHALKSSSRLLGATQLSEDAAHLEACGDAAQAGDEGAKQEIAAKTAPLLKLYRSYYDKLMPLMSDGEDDDLRPEIPQDELSEAMGAIREFVEAFDIDSADGVLDMLKDYRMPADFAERYEQIKRALSAVDRDALLKLL